jgi:DNA (cytosine-5)-methyltransferase 1
MRHGSLFSGIGGFDLAAEWMGWQNVFHCEMNEFGQRVLNHYWPQAELFTDITKSDFTKYANTIDVLTGGFPCQPYSVGGKRLGKQDDRHLWPEMCRAIREITPRYIVGENVRGLTNWNGGLVFDEVCSDLEALGYQVAPCIIPASSCNAPHKRERIWFVAYRDIGSGQKHELRSGWNVPKEWVGGSGVTSDPERIRLEHAEEIGDLSKRTAETQEEWSFIANTPETNGGNGDASNPRNERLQGGEVKTSTIEKEGEGKLYRNAARQIRDRWKDFPTQPPICGGDDGLPTELDGITFSKWRNESIRAYGNAVVPNVVFEIFKAIELCENKI